MGDRGGVEVGVVRGVVVRGCCSGVRGLGGQGGFLELLERRAECGHELRRQLLDEADRVREENLGWGVRWGM